ncbi:hypothetical protein KDN24_08410 [Bacillus sp. Bva_UNVM-123]|uniref:GAP1-N2 domain-containing protein n=1 Tax=Bacillus sp. Bva_UNVM-123 TaxID=2829798 RepID=UPI00391F742F
MSRIQQHMYTREREGVFTSSPGYDTIAVSKGLDHLFIKNIIHPLCTYYPPKELTSIGERDEGKYPKSKLITITETGELILGQSVYKDSDYTGERETFFTHNYIVPKERVCDYLYSTEAVFGKLSFQTKYDLASGKQLEELDNLPSEKITFKPLNSILAEIQISPEQFQQLVFALISSLTSKKKVYVSLPGNVVNSTEMAFQLAYYLFQCVPFELRKSFGFISYSAEPQNKKNINLMFVEKGSIRPNDSLISKDFVFDFAQGIYLNAKENIEAHPFIKFAYECLQKNPSKLAEFYVFAKNALCEKKVLSLQTYNDLVALYSIKDGNYSETKYKISSLFKIFRSFLTIDNIDQKVELYDLLVKLVSDEIQKITENALPDDDAIIEILHFSSLFAQKDFGKLTSYLVYSLYYGSKDLKYFNQVYQHIKQYPSLFKRVNATILKNPKLVPAIFERYVKMRFNTITSLKELVNEVKFMLDHNPEVVGNYVFEDLTKQTFLSIFKKERDLLKAFYTVKRDLSTVRKQDERVILFIKTILNMLSLEVIRGLKLESLGPDEFEQASLIVSNIPVEFRNGDIKEKIELIGNVYVIMEKRHFTELERFIQNSNFDKLQAIILKLLPTSHLIEQTEKIAFCFYNKEHRVDTIYHYDKMFSYVDSNGGIEAMRNFLQRFTRMWGGTHFNDPVFKLAVGRYIKAHAKEIFSEKRVVKRWEVIHPYVKKAMEEVKFQQRSAIGKFLHKNIKAVTLSLIVFMTIVIIGGAGALVYKHLEEEKAAEALAAQKEAERKEAIAAQEKAEKEKAEAEQMAAKIITLQAMEINYKDIDKDGQVSISDVLTIKSSAIIDDSNLSTLEQLTIIYKEKEAFEIKNVTEGDLEFSELKDSVDLKITEANLADVEAIVEKVINEAEELNESSEM